RVHQRLIAERVVRGELDDTTRIAVEDRRGGAGLKPHDALARADAVALELGHGDVRATATRLRGDQCARPVRGERLREARLPGKRGLHARGIEGRGQLWIRVVRYQHLPNAHQAEKLVELAGHESTLSHEIVRAGLE